MASTVYMSRIAATLQNRKQFYIRIADMLLHLDSLNLNLISITRDANNFVVITLNNPLPPEQQEHLLLDGPV